MNAIKIPPLIKHQTEKHDECKADDWVYCWILLETINTTYKTREDGIMFCACIGGSKIKEWFNIDVGLKINAENYRTRCLLRDTGKKQLDFKRKYLFI